MRKFYPIFNVLTRVVYAMTLAIGIIGNWWDILQTQIVLGLTWQGLAFILFVLSSVVVIAQLILKLQKYEDIYEYALSFDGLVGAVRDKEFQVGLIFTNTIAKPLEYQVDIKSLYIEIGDHRPVNPNYTITSGVIPIGKSAQFNLAPIEMPHNFPCRGKLSYVLVYGPPHKMMFQEEREMIFDDIKYVYGQIYLKPLNTLLEHKPLGNKTMIRKILGID